MKREREEEKFNVYLQWVRRGKMQTEAARLARLPIAKVRQRRQTDMQFRNDELEAHEEFKEKVESVLTDAAFGVVHYAVDEDGQPVYDKNGNKVPAQRDTKAALEWLKARQASVFNPARQVDINVNQQVQLDFSEFHKLRAELEGRRPAQLTPGQDYEEIIEAEIVEPD